ncbi:MAG: hypothetical protein LBE12_05125 [Planctomycetaceae bacterium]|jgi:hypothetical protein|nr:hypothetical protein [Planctomycetaceae bacterium]
MKNFSTTIFCINLWICLLTFVQQQSLAEQTYFEDRLWIREGNENYRVKFTGTWVEYANDENCANNDHKTTKGQQRYFGHVHVNYSLPRTGMDQYNTPREVTVAKIKAYWDNEYNMSSSGGEDVKYNCWGYASSASEIGAHKSVFIVIRRAKFACTYNCNQRSILFLSLISM